MSFVVRKDPSHQFPYPESGLKNEERAKAEAIRIQGKKEIEAVQEKARHERRDFEEKIIAVEQFATNKIREREAQIAQLSDKIKDDIETQEKNIRDRINKLNEKFRDGWGAFDYIETFFGILFSIILAFSNIPWALWLGIGGLIATFCSVLLLTNGSVFPEELSWASAGGTFRAY